MIELSLKLLIAHVIGDFVFQPNSWIEHKKINTYKSKYLYIHGFIHLVANLVLLQFKTKYLIPVVVIVLSHIIIDLFKFYLEKKINSRWAFLIDQVLHLSILFTVVYTITSLEINLSIFYAKEVLLFTLALLLSTFVSSIAMKVIMSKWKLKEDSTEESLVKAGKYIGVLERLLVFGFIVLNHWNIIGWLITAKSIFRFGDLTRAKDRKLTEYILIGTLLSFGMASLMGFLYVYLAYKI